MADNDGGLPSWLNKKEVALSDGTLINPNPLYSYTFQKAVLDNLSSGSDPDYSKLAGYTTKRFPLSGLVGDTIPGQAQATDEYNAQYEYPKNIEPLNQNIKDWLQSSKTSKDPKTVYHGTYHKFVKCLDAPNYTLFSNTSSARQYNQENLNREKTAFDDHDVLVVPLETPHNDMHLATGGFPKPSADTAPQNPPSPLIGANGDMVSPSIRSSESLFTTHTGRK